MSSILTSGTMYETREATGLRLHIAHLNKVQSNLNAIITLLLDRLVSHDESKLSDEELSLILNKGSLGKTAYLSEEEREIIERIRPAIDNHYELNSHHPEHYNEGINGMSLIDLLEMLADWKAASETYNREGTFEASLILNRSRFNMCPEVYKILLNTAKQLNWE